jgi:hypothetical protein
MIDKAGGSEGRFLPCAYPTGTVTKTARTTSLPGTTSRTKALFQGPLPSKCLSALALTQLLLSVIEVKDYHFKIFAAILLGFDF